MTKVIIPPGLVDKNIELFLSDGNLLATHAGSVKRISDLPNEFINAAIAKMHTNPSTVMALELSGYNSVEDQLAKFLECQYGNFDFSPDFISGEFRESEYHDCGFRGECPMEGIVCSFLKINGQIITPFEIEIIKLLSTEDTLPVIAEKLEVSINNLEEKKKVLFQKFKVLSRARLVAECYNHQILNPTSHVNL